MPGHKKKAFCGGVYCSNGPWQQLDSTVITKEQVQGTGWSFLRPALAARRSRWSQLHHGLQYFSQGRCGTAFSRGATDQPGSQKPGSDFFPTDLACSMLGDVVACGRTRTHTCRAVVLQVLTVAPTVGEQFERRVVIPSPSYNPSAAGEAD